MFCDKFLCQIQLSIYSSKFRHRDFSWESKWLTAEETDTRLVSKNDKELPLATVLKLLITQRSHCDGHWLGSNRTLA